MSENRYIFDALTALGVNGCQLAGHPTNESEFLSTYSERTGVDSMNTAVMSSNSNDFSVTWQQVSVKAQEIEDAQPLRDLRQVRNAKLAETDWIVIKEREEGGSVSNFADWKTYRQALRDITDSATSLDDVTWPEKP